jgi:ribosomal protein S18 acetylase RimI-like enzyme
MKFQAGRELLSEIVLDNPIWTSLIAGHRKFAIGQDVGSGMARRYPPAIGPFAGMQDQSDTAFEDLGQVVPPGETVAVLFDSDPIVPPDWRVARTLSLVQMIQRTEALNRNEGPEIVRLAPTDMPEMVSLAKLTEPGPFSSETAILGEFFGVRIEGKLIAMAGQRFKPEGFVEMSAVCTHPDYRGRGLARELVCKVTSEIRSDGSVPFLTCMKSNTGAIKLYETLGFSYRRSFVLGILKHQA